jgi:hypothetical protein
MAPLAENAAYQQYLPFANILGYGTDNASHLAQESVLDEQINENQLSDADGSGYHATDEISTDDMINTSARTPAELWASFRQTRDAFGEIEENLDIILVRHVRAVMNIAERANVAYFRGQMTGEGFMDAVSAASALAAPVIENYHDGPMNMEPDFEGEMSSFVYADIHADH